MAKKQFKAESKRLLDLMINSIYTHKEIFLRELISNASDAVDKLAYKALTDDQVGLNRSDFKITLTPDQIARTLTISDNGIGMTKEELEQNLGTIARSGSLQFKQELAKQENGGEHTTDIIGQFGVGFYSAFMVADHVTVTSRAYGSDEAWQWASDGADGYTLTPCEKESAGTDIVLHIKQNTEDDHYDEYLEQYRLADLVKKYSDYIHYPIVMLMHKSRQKPRPEDAGDDYKPEWEDFDEWETLNSMVPLWQRPKSEVTAEEYNQFYKEKYGDWEDPLSVVHVSAEGAVEYKAMLYIPAHAPYDFHSREYQKGLQLYSSGVLIMDKCADLLPEHFRFVKGVVDSQDFSLNISREMLQHTRQLKVIAGNLEKKIKAELLRLQKDDREKYETFWKAFGTQIKVGVVSDYGAHKELLKDLLLFFSSKEGKLTSLAEYKARMPEEQKYIYYACGEGRRAACQAAPGRTHPGQGLRDPLPHRRARPVRHRRPGRGGRGGLQVGGRRRRPPRDRRGEGRPGAEGRGEQARAGLPQGDPGRRHQGGPGVQNPEERRGVPHRRRPHHPGDGEVFPAGGPRERQKHEGPAGAGAQPRLGGLRRPQPGGGERPGQGRPVREAPLRPGSAHRRPASGGPRRLH